MDIEQMHAIEHECRKVILQLGRHSDLEEHKEAAALFTPDGVFQGAVKTVGREAYIGLSNDRIPGDQWRRRVLTNMIVTVHDGDHATATAYWMQILHKKADVVEGKVSNAAPTHFCESEDQFVRLDEGWRIARRDFKATIGKHGK